MSEQSNDKLERLARAFDDVEHVITRPTRDAVIEECARAAERRFAKATAHHTVSAIVEAIRALKVTPVGLVEQLESALRSQIEIANTERASKERAEAELRIQSARALFPRLRVVSDVVWLDLSEHDSVSVEHLANGNLSQRGRAAVVSACEKARSEYVTNNPADSDVTP